jgi:hypothetical protein
MIKKLLKKMVMSNAKTLSARNVSNEILGLNA